MLRVPCEKFREDFQTKNQPPLPSKKEMVKLAEVRKFAREFSHGLDLNKELKFLTIKGQLISKCPFDIFKSPKKPTNYF